jgi:hypothetical protein
MARLLRSTRLFYCLSRRLIRVPRHVALLEIQNKDFRMTPITLRTVRPFVIEEVTLSEVAEETGLDLNDQMEITKFLRGKVSDAFSQPRMTVNTFISLFNFIGSCWISH